MTSIRSIVLSLFLLLALTRQIQAAGDQAGVDWYGGVVTAVGYGTAPKEMVSSKAILSARRAAEIDAKRALLEAVKGVHIDTKTTVDGSMQRDVSTRTHVEGVIRGAVITRQEVTMVNGAPVATVTMRLCIDGRSAECAGKPSLVSAIDLDCFASTNDPSAAQMERSDSRENPIPPEPATYDRTRPATSAILLLNGKMFERVLLPVVVSQLKGELTLIYGVRRVAPELVRTYGIVRYASSLDQASGMESAGANPVLISVQSVLSDNRIVIAPQDAAILEESLRFGNNFLEKGRVVIVQ